MSRLARKRTLKRISKIARRRSLLPSIDREYDLYDITTATRSGPAKALGLGRKGHLGLGADADITIYSLNPEKVDPSKEYNTIRKAFSQATYTIKDGEIVVKDGEIVKPTQGRTFWVDTKLSSQTEPTKELRRKFSEYWTVDYENYPVSEDYLAESAAIYIEARI